MLTRVQLRRNINVTLIAKLSTTNFTNTTKSSSKGSSPSAHLVRSITVKVGADQQLLFYPRLQARHPHIFHPPKSVPTEGVTLTVRYADSATFAPNPKTFDRTIVALHGTPGYLEHFDVLFREYAANQSKTNKQARVRIIAPNLPDFSHTRSSGGIFWHTTEEKVAFVRDLLVNRLGVRQVDCLVAHSMGAQTALGLAEAPGPGLKIGSIALLAPQPQWDVPDPRVRAFARLLFRFRSEVWYRLLTAAQLQRRLRSNFKFSSTNELLLALTTILDTQAPLDLPRRVFSLARGSSSSSAVPVIIQYGTKEPVISRRAQLALCTEHFGVPEDRFIHLDFSGNDNDRKKELELEKITADGDRIKVYYIRDGNHFAHARYGQATVKMINSLMGSVD